TFDLSAYDLVISSSSAFAKGLIVKPRTMHLCYCHAPSRFLWDWNQEYLADQSRTAAFFARPAAHFIRLWDRGAAHRVDRFIANSEYTRQRIWKYYRRKATVIYPPVTVAPREAIQATPGDSFCIVSWLTPYKRIDVAIEAFNKLELPLVIIGDGPDRPRLERLAHGNVTFTGYLPDGEVWAHLRNACALVFPGEDDFGITIVEAMGFGVPVLAHRGGGAREIIREGITGEFFDDLTPEVLADGIRRLREARPSYDRALIRSTAEAYSEESFIASFQSFVEKEGILRIEKTEML
ncbi:MAG: glycosyltransferase, partial [Parcubacteria group bacterium]|nr:glycosyltransferase [Parcubacteria group bacterium]